MTFIDITELRRAETLVRNQLHELQTWYEVTLGREDRVQELKREVNELCRQLGQVPRYPSQDSAPNTLEAQAPAE